MTTLDVCRCLSGSKNVRPVLFCDRCYATLTTGSTRQPWAGHALANHEARAAVTTSFKAILLQSLEGCFCDAAETILRAAAAGGACPPSKRTLPMTCMA